MTMIFLLIRFEREAKISNICSRRYQAPELIFGAKNIQHPLISGQLVVSLLSFFWDRFLAMQLDNKFDAWNPNHKDFRFLPIKARPWHKS
ncbi:Protein kinase superfamily protein [Prunus dulcis]|uniref:Protein kinase superfamily protein n=1 Tax=Prunus dulcis TaxID=3755 RepID=A0A4Y1R5T1_PRUDU|nr:Protein kinase superfamily protein [Prunus dulcis]